MKELKRTEHSLDLGRGFSLGVRAQETEKDKWQ